ncbi:hypothetical protein RDI58_024171 [Solanum bulbocastanum]|uniref:MADS-box domain-containing protein n=1 Tax=Solanum bulbocastanum TaxID=147425 RepID=A0AAN8T0K1_SOLBU
MEHKKTAGRQKISLAKIENESARFTTFSKRRSGLYKKACELVREYDVDLGIVMSSPKGIPYSFISPTSNVVIDCFINPTGKLSVRDRLLVAQAHKKFEVWLTSGEFNLNENLEQLENGASSSSQIPSDDANILPNVF